MKIQISIVGEHYKQRVLWPEDWPPPPVGAEIALASDAYVYVRAAVWYPQGDPENDQPEPFVYVVLGSTRP